VAVSLHQDHRESVSMAFDLELLARLKEKNEESDGRTE